MTKEETDETNSVTQIYSWDEVGRILSETLGYCILSLRLILPTEMSGNTGGMKRMYGNRIKYRIWMREIKKQHGSIIDYISQERLRWPVLPTSNSDRLVFETRNTVPLADPADYKITWNDWPYGSLESDVKHLVVWLKQVLGTDSVTGRLLPSEQLLVQRFVEQNFLEPMSKRGISEDRLRWYKNGLDLQSVKEIDHFHVLIKGIPDDILLEWTNEPEPVL